MASPELASRRFRGFLPIVIDVETGGFHSRTDALLEIAAVIIEVIFAWPGIGRLVVSSVASRDVPMVVASVIVTSALFIVVNLIVDLLYSVINPMVRQ